MNKAKIEMVIEKVKEKISQEIKETHQELELLSNFSKNFSQFASNFEINNKTKTAILRYKTSSIFLKECADYLTSISNEVIHLVTGIELDQGVYVLDKMEKIKFQSSPIGAKAEMDDLIKKLVELDEDYGHLLLAVFHSHPFHGVAGTQPSGIDKSLQQTLESAGYEAIQAIFSRDGYIRFFSNNLKFEIEIYGRGLEKIEGGKDNETVFKLVNFQKKEVKNLSH